MKKNLLIAINCVVLFSCKINNTPKEQLSKNESVIAENKKIKKIAEPIQDSIDIYIPEFALVSPDYISIDKIKFSKNDLLMCEKIQSILKGLGGNFLGDTDDNDILGHPDLDYDGLTIWVNDSNRKKVAFNAKKISKRYGFYYNNDKLILVTEATKKNNGFKMDSIFFDEKILIWKNISNNYVTDKKTIKGKEEYLKKISKEIQDIYDNELGYIERYNYKKDSLSSFVIANLKN